jgi:hypothetical protein
MVANIPPRKDINHGMTAPKPPAPMGPHISQAVREALKDQDPEIARHVREVADTK